MGRKLFKVSLIFCLLASTIAVCSGQNIPAIGNPGDDPEYMSSFKTGREYFFLRSGHARLIIQSDKSGFAPAFTYMLFDAGKPGQSARKVNAINYVEGSNFSSTALKVILGTVEFSSLGTNTTAEWINANGKPSVKLGWWAGGIQVTEIFSPSDRSPGFDRRILLTNSDMSGDDTLKLAALDGYPETKPIPVKKGETITIDRQVKVPALLASDIPDIPVNALSTISTSDSLISRLYRNASFTLPGMVAPDGHMDAGVFEYGNQWVRDGSNVARGLIYCGAFECAKGLLGYILSDLVSAEGATIIAGGFDEPDREQFDQMGELMNCLKLYIDWTGDKSLVLKYRDKILKLIERPLNPVFRDSSGMVHNRREFWERTFSDAYELAYQTYMTQGLKDAADLAPLLGAEDKAAYWREQADLFRNAMLHHPKLSLVENGTLIKRRNVTGDIADLTTGRQLSYKNDAPGPTEYYHRLNPDATYALPVIFSIIDPHSGMAIKTLDKLEAIWNSRWYCGGYERYHSSSQIDQPGPWTFGTAFIARAQHAAGLYERSRRSLQWLNDIQGGNAGAWFEEIPLNRSQIPWCGIVPWTSAEVTSFAVREWLGIRISNDCLIITPELFPGTGKTTADLRFRSGRLNITIDNIKGKLTLSVNGVKLKMNPLGEYLLPVKDLR